MRTDGGRPGNPAAQETDIIRLLALPHRFGKLEIIKLQKMFLT